MDKHRWRNICFLPLSFTPLLPCTLLFSSFFPICLLHRLKGKLLTGDSEKNMDGGKPRSGRTNPFLEPSGHFHSSRPSFSLSNANLEGARNPLHSSGGFGAAFQTQLHPGVPTGAFSMLTFEILPFLLQQCSCSYLARVCFVLSFFLYTKVGSDKSHAAFPAYNSVWDREM